MQNYGNPAGRMPSTNGINSKVSAPAGAQGKGVGLGGPMEKEGDNPVKVGGAGKGSVKGFSGGLINPKV